MSNNLKKNNKNGYIALTTVSLITAFILIFVISITLQIVDDSKISFGLEQHRKAVNNATSCVEIGLQRIASDPNASTTNELLSENSGEIECYLNIDDNPYPDKIIIASSTVGEYPDSYTSIMKVIVATTSPNVEIVEWNKNYNQ